MTAAHSLQLARLVGVWDGGTTTYDPIAVTIAARSSLENLSKKYTTGVI